jgi:hypothetical protein
MLFAWHIANCEMADAMIKTVKTTLNSLQAGGFALRAGRVRRFVLRRVKRFVLRRLKG